MSLALTLLPADVADDERLLLDGALPPLGLGGVGFGVRGAFPKRGFSYNLLTVNFWYT